MKANSIAVLRPQPSQLHMRNSIEFHAPTMQQPKKNGWIRSRLIQNKEPTTCLGARLQSWSLSEREIRKLAAKHNSILVELAVMLTNRHHSAPVVLVLLAWLTFGSLAQAYYNPSAGRWLSRDPIDEAGGPNLMAIGNGDVVNRYDKLGLNPSAPEDPPSGNINPAPRGPFSKCRIALRCNTAHGPGGIPVGFKHCGLVIDTGSSVYGYDGSGGSVNYRWLTPATSAEATGPWKDFDSSVCECLFSNIASWNGRNVPRNNLCENSNWNLKCALKKCSVALDWGSQDKPLGYDCQECVKWTYLPPEPPIPRRDRCCIELREKPCPDE